MAFPLPLFLFLFSSSSFPLPLFLFLFSSSAYAQYHYAIEDTAANQVIRRGTTSTTGIPVGTLILAPNSTYRYWRYKIDTAYIGFIDFTTGGNGQTFNIPSVRLRLPSSFDADGDRLDTGAEFVIGTSPNQFDTDNDGLSDGAEVQQGLNPADGLPGPIGLLHSVDTLGTAMDVTTFDDVAVMADSTNGISVFNVFNTMSPIIIAQVDTPGTARAVAYTKTTLS